MNAAPISTSQAVSILKEARDKAQDVAHNGEQAAMGNELGAKTAGVTAAVQQHKGEVMDSVTKAAASTGGMLLNTKLATKAASPLSIKDQKAEADQAYKARKGAQNAGLQSATQGGALAQLVDKGHDVLSQTVGGQAMASQAKIAGKQAELAETMAKQGHEGFKALREQAGKDQDAVSDFVKGIYSNAKAVADKIFG